VIGLITASFAVIPLVVALPLGRVADRHRPAGMLAAGVALLAASFLLLGRAGSLAELALSRLRSGCWAGCWRWPRPRWHASRGEAQPSAEACLDQPLWEIEALRRALAPSMWAAMAAMAASRSPRSIASKIGRCSR